MSYEQIAWLPLCAGVTAAGLVLSFIVLRRRGAGAGLRGAAWSLIPLAAYLTGALPALWQAGTAVAGFVAGLVFSPMVWAGVAVAGLSVLLFMVSGLLRRRGRRAAPAERPARAPQPAAPAAGAGAGAPTQPNRRPLPPKQAAPAADDDLSDIEEILKRRGIS
ncbi:cellulose synthase [Sphaerisporangium sp. TRM90804]|uniref:cellulose synthase n=1 Tax=Sphaerisporangium sp. TRM90804 TaxID=3031113 RepID=UPI00244A1FA2|nr:cellulose synthase [Sphaerisporangium sp. TRM90804]MDH2430692.1 cellulose synthase [Sphaerisporangium sp. TRM90804]